MVKPEETVLNEEMSDPGPLQQTLGTTAMEFQEDFRKPCDSDNYLTLEAVEGRGPDISDAEAAVLLKSIRMYSHNSSDTSVQSIHDGGLESANRSSGYGNVDGLSSSSVARKLADCTNLLIRVDQGVVGTLPSSMVYPGRPPPCTVFAVVNMDSGDVVWKFVKDASQLRDFRNSIHSNLRVLAKKSDTLLPNFPQKGFFYNNIPWQVDVRNDMMNAYFKTIYRLNSNPIVLKDAKNTKTINGMRMALTNLWLSDLVDEWDRSAVSASFANRGLDLNGEMSGYLFSKPYKEAMVWNCRYYVLDGAYLDVIDNLESKKLHRRISLKNAFVQKKVVYFNAKDFEDARYEIKLYERTKSKEVIHRLSAETEAKRVEWITKLRTRVAKIKSGEIGGQEIFYTQETLPLPYLLRQPRVQKQAAAPIPVLPVPASGTASMQGGMKHSESMNLPTSSSYVRMNEYVSKRKHTRSSTDDIDIFGDDESRNNDGGPKSSDSGDVKISRPVPLQIPRPSTVSSDLTDELSLPRSPSLIPGSSSYPISLNHMLGHSREHSSRDGSDVLQDGSILSADSTGSFKAAALLPQKPDYPRKIFGVMPEDCKYLVESAHGEKIPSIVARCTMRLREPGTTSEIGIFRISGTQKLIDELQEVFDLNGDFDIAAAHVDPHTTADLLKRYLRSLPGCLYGDWNEVKVTSFMALPEPTKIDVLRIELESMDPITRGVIREITSLLWLVSQKESENSMSVRNLSVALSPALHIPGNILSLYINHYQQVLSVPKYTLDNQGEKRGCTMETKSYE